MASLSLKSKTLLLAAIVVTWMLVAVPMVGYAEENEIRHQQAKDLVALRAKGIATEEIEEERTRMPAGIGLLIKLGMRNESRVPFRVLKGRVKVGKGIYNVTGGGGVILLRRHVALMRFEALNADGESVWFKFAVRYVRVAESLYRVRMAGALEAEGNTIFLLLRGFAKTL